MHVKSMIGGVRIPHPFTIHLYGPRYREATPPYRTMGGGGASRVFMYFTYVIL